MRIVITDFDDLTNPYGGGQAIRTFEIAKRLALKHDLTVVTFGHWGKKPKVVEAVRFVPIGFGRFPINHLSYLAQLPKTVSKIPHDIVLEQWTPPIGMSLPPLPLVTKAPVVASLSWFFSQWMSRKYHLPFAKLTFGLAKSYRFAIGMTEFDAARFRKLNPHAKVWTIHYAADSPDVVRGNFGMTQLSIEPDFEYILFLGRLDIHQKGLDLLIKIFVDNREKLPVLIVAGEGRERKRLLRMIVRKGLSDRVILLGRVDGERKQLLIAKARALAVPSRYETFGQVVIQAFAQRTPVVMFNLPQFRKIVPQGYPLFAPAFDLARFGQLLRRVCQDVDFRSKIVTQYLLARQFIDWDTIADYHQKVFDQVVLKNQRRE